MTNARSRSNLHANGEPVLGRRRKCDKKLLSILLVVRIQALIATTKQACAATYCELSHRFHLANSSISVTHVFVLLPTFFARGFHYDVGFAQRNVACQSQPAPTICGGLKRCSIHARFHATWHSALFLTSVKGNDPLWNQLPAEARAQPPRPPPCPSSRGRGGCGAGSAEREKKTIKQECGRLRCITLKFNGPSQTKVGRTSIMEINSSSVFFGPCAPLPIPNPNTIREG